MIVNLEHFWFGRREFVKVGAATLGGLSLPPALSAGAASSGLAGCVKDKSVVLLFMHGGPSQIETFDPKMSAPPEIRSQTGELSTTIPGVTFGGTFPLLAQLAHRVSVVRSFVTGDGNHDIKPVVSSHTLNANLGSLYARVVGVNNARTGLPTNAAVFPQSVDPTTMPAITNFGRFGATGTIGESYAPFVPGGDGDFQKNLQLSLPLSVLDDRRSLLRHFDRVHASIDRTGVMDGVDSLRRQAIQTVVGGAAKAFDLSHEHPRVVDRYDTSKLMTAEQIDKKWKNHSHYVDNVKTLGKLLLLARRLCEAGCGFVTVTTSFVWDMHSDVNNAGVAEGMRYMGTPFDRAVSAFITDVESRGLTDRILLVCCGEMGRTPRVNKTGGRDHWGRLAPLLVSGGGLRMGQVIGQSNRDAGEASSRAYTIPNLIATIAHTLFDVGQLRLQDSVPLNVRAALTNDEPIVELLG